MNIVPPISDFREIIMKTQASFAPKNSLILVLDPSAGDIPNSMARQLVASTPSCIAVGTMSASDGETMVVLTDDKQCLDFNPTMQRVFEGFIDTPRMEVSVCTVDIEPILSLRVSAKRTGVEVWVNHEREPNRVYVLIIAGNLGKSGDTILI